MIDLQTITAAKWHRTADNFGRALGGTVFIWLIFCCGLAANFDSWLPGIALLAPLVAILVLEYRWFRHRRYWQYKLFFVPVTEATQVVSQVLQKKGIPFRQVEKGAGQRAQTSFELEDGTLVIDVAGRLHSNQRMAHVLIRPAGRDNRLLAQSLQEKIDEAFRPQGLTK